MNLRSTKSQARTIEGLCSRYLETTMVNHCTIDKIQTNHQGLTYYPEEVLLKQREEWLKRADGLVDGQIEEFDEAMEQVWMFTIDAFRSRKMAVA